MSTLLLVAGLILTMVGATAGAALVAEGRRELARAADRRLRGGREPAPWVAEVELYLGAAGALTALGVVLLGIAFPAVVTGFAGAALAAVLLFAGVPTLLLLGYLAPRWVARAAGGRSAHVAVPLIAPFTRILSPVLPAPRHGGDAASLVREALASGVTVDRELALAGGVMTFAERPVREVMTPRTEVVALPEEATRGDARPMSMSPLRPTRDHSWTVGRSLRGRHLAARVEPVVVPGVEHEVAPLDPPPEFLQRVRPVVLRNAPGILHEGGQVAGQGLDGHEFRSLLEPLDADEPLREPELGGQVVK